MYSSCLLVVYHVGYKIYHKVTHFLLKKTIKSVKIESNTINYENSWNAAWKFFVGKKSFQNRKKYSPLTFCSRHWQHFKDRACSPNCIPFSYCLFLGSSLFWSQFDIFRIILKSMNNFSCKIWSQTYKKTSFMDVSKLVKWSRYSNLQVCFIW